MDVGTWSGGLAEWIDGDTAYLSIAFSWRLNDAYQRAVFYKAQGYKVRAGGPGVFTRKHFLADVAEIGGAISDAVARHNPMATSASRGCDVGCWWCIVPKMEGRTYTELPDFPVRPVLCDNNLSGLSIEYQRHIVERYKSAGVPLLDANSGFAPAKFDADTFALWSQINRGPWRFAYDCMDRRAHVDRVMAFLRSKGVPPKRQRVYVMIGNEPVEACMDRINETIGWKGEPHVQPFMKLNALAKQPAVRHDWSPQLLRDVARWANRRHWRYCKFSEYRRAAHTTRDARPAPIADLFATADCG